MSEQSDPSQIDPSNIRALLTADSLGELDRMANGSHMVPVIEYGDCWECETTRGEGFVVPAHVQYIPNEIGGEPTSDTATFSRGDDDDAHGLPLSVAGALAQYMPEGCSGEVASATVRRGAYLCRMSAPGYMDCTDWEAHDTAQAAADSLIQYHGD